MTPASPWNELVFPGFAFGKDDPKLAEKLVRLGVGGFCLYGGTASSIAALVRRLQKIAAVPLLFAGDYEDGLPSQIPDGTRFPSNMGLGAAGKNSLAFEKARLTALEARAIGVRWVFAPVIDLATRPENPIVNLRSFGRDPIKTAALANAYLRGITRGGGLSCLKHFPGHGDTDKDSHLALPKIQATRGELFARDLVPYKKTLKGTDSVMTGHLIVPALGDKPGIPATLSKKALTGLLRKKLGFDKIVVTDALSMRAIAGRFGEVDAAIRSLQAGADLILVPASPLALLRSLSKKIDRSPELQTAAGMGLKRLRRAKIKAGLFRDGGMPAKNPLSRLSRPEAIRSSAKMAAAALSWARPLFGSLPDRIGYMEPENPSPSRWKGKHLIKALKSLGITAVPFKKGFQHTLLVGTFVGPKAYSGRIRLSAAQVRRTKKALVSAPSSVVACFGNPFVLDQLRGFDAALCAFSSSAPSQTAAAGVLAGKQKASGRMPVKLL